jgi:hypothetical protein
LPLPLSMQALVRSRPPEPCSSNNQTDLWRRWHVEILAAKCRVVAHVHVLLPQNPGDRNIDSNCAQDITSCTAADPGTSPSFSLDMLYGTTAAAGSGLRERKSAGLAFLLASIRPPTASSSKLIPLRSSSKSIKMNRRFATWAFRPMVIGGLVSSVQDQYGNSLAASTEREGFTADMPSQAISIVYPKVESSGTSIPRSSDDFTISGSFVYQTKVSLCNGSTAHGVKHVVSSNLGF